MSREGKRKCEKILSEGYGRKDYFTKAKPEQVRQFFATRTDMLAIAGNFSVDRRRFQRTDWLCRCGKRQEQEHLNSDESLVPFFQEVLDKRDRILKEERKKDIKEKDD